MQEILYVKIWKYNNNNKSNQNLYYLYSDITK